jgi:hypothetical protein
VPNGHFSRHSSWAGHVREALIYIYNGTNTDVCENSENWLEVNRCKYLFNSGQSWTYQDANDFALQASRYVGFTS